MHSKKVLVYKPCEYRTSVFQPFIRNYNLSDKCNRRKRSFGKKY